MIEPKHLPYTAPWKTVLNLTEKLQPRLFDEYYHFHYFYGLDEDDLSPLERLTEIMDFEEGEGARFQDAFVSSALQIASIGEDEAYEYSIEEEGIFLHPTSCVS
jgi:hypothetical protein